MLLDDSGRLLLGTTTEGDTAADDLTVAGSGACGITVRSGSTSTGNMYFSDATSGSGEYDGYVQYDHNARKLHLGSGAGTRITVNEYGMTGFSVTSPDALLSVLAQNSNTPPFVIQNPDADENFTIATYHDGNGIYGTIGVNYKLNSGGNGVVDTTDHRTAGIMFDGRNNGAIMFDTNDAGSQPAERFRINSSNILTGTSTVLAGSFDTIRVNNSASHVGTVIRTSGGGGNAQHDEYCWLFHRMGTDGKLVAFNHAGSEEGNISVSGSTVSYNGGHLSRWSQLVGISTNSKSDRPTIYQGTVMSNLDEMCEWTGEDNQQLNKTKVSTLTGDKDVAGVFWAWDDDDDEYTNDFYIAMTGDMVVRVGAATTITRGDLLESAGDGTAKPQSDDIVRSKTVAKITSTTSTATYSDGSKAYPCLLMAC